MSFSFGWVVSASKPSHELEDGIVPAWQGLMAEVRVNGHLLVGPYLVVGRKLGGGRANRIHQPHGHEDPGLNSMRQVLHVDISQFGKYPLLLPVQRVEQSEILLKLEVGVFGKIHFPDALVVTKKWKIGGSQFDSRFQCRANECQRSGLGCLPWRRHGMRLPWEIPSRGR